MGLFDIFSSKNADKAAAARKAGLQAGYDQASGLYDTGRGELRTNYASALEPWMNLSASNQGGYDLYRDLTGAGGAEGQARASALFQTDPGYQFTMDQALEAVKRGAAGTGMLASGNTLTALQDRASNLASQQYGQWANRLLPFVQQAPQIAGGQAALYAGMGDRLLNSYTGQGDVAYRTQSGMGEADAQAALDRNRASGQAWNAIFGGIDLATKLFGGGGGGGNLGNFAMMPSPNGPGTFAPVAI